MKIENLKVYDLEESIISSGYPMRVCIEEFEENKNAISYWLSKEKFLKDFFKYQKEYGVNKGLNNKQSCLICGDNFKVQLYKKDGNYYCNKHRKNIIKNGLIWEKFPKYNLKKDHIEVEIKGVFPKISIVKIDYMDIDKFFYGNWNVNEYCNSSEEGLFHRYIFNGEIEKGKLVDHINKDKLDNRRCNLRLCTNMENSFNSRTKKSNTSGVSGVSFKIDRQKWKSYINVNGKQLHLGYFSDKNDAIISRLYAEVNYYGEFSPQKYLFEEYGINNISFKSEYENGEILGKAINDIKRIQKLGNAKAGSGHDNALKGIRVSFDLTFTNKAWVEAERYGHFDIVSSQSTMHKITKMDIWDSTNEYVWGSTVEMLQMAINHYNVIDDKNSEQAKQLYLEILYNAPAGLELTARISTNYAQLKTIHNQRKNHRLPEWRSFTKEIEKLPLFKELCLTKK